jgi:transcriptional regulator with XRE-family HTH domain
MIFRVHHSDRFPFRIKTMQPKRSNATLSTPDPIGQFVLSHRQANKLRQKEFRELAGVGTGLISELERGKPTLRLDAVAASSPNCVNSFRRFKAPRSGAPKSSPINSPPSAQLPASIAGDRRNNRRSRIFISPATGPPPAGPRRWKERSAAVISRPTPS